MTDALTAACARAMHVVTPEGQVLRAGRASLYILGQLGWRRTATALSRRPLVWAVEVGYGLVARGRSLISRLLLP